MSFDNPPTLLVPNLNVKTFNGTFMRPQRSLPSSDINIDKLKEKHKDVFEIVDMIQAVYCDNKSPPVPNDTSAIVRRVNWNDKVTNIDGTPLKKQRTTRMGSNSFQISPAHTTTVSVDPYQFAASTNDLFDAQAYLDSERAKEIE